MTQTTSSTPTKSPAGAGSEIPPTAGDAAPPPAEKPDRVTAVSNLTLGSLLMAIDFLDDWVDNNVPTQAQALEHRAKAEDVLLPQSEWEATYGRPEADRVRFVVMGIAASANTRAVRATRFVLRTGGGRWTPQTGRWITSSCSDRCATGRIALQKPRTNRSIGGWRREGNWTAGAARSLGFRWVAQPRIPWMS